MKININELEISNKQVETLAFNIYKDVNTFVKNNRENFDKWLIYELIAIALKELKEWNDKRILLNGVK